MEEPDGTDKSELSHKVEQTVIRKKRYVIGPELGTTSAAHHGSIDVTAGAQGGMEFWIPRAAHRFHFTGGTRFVHGGAMPQEVVVPVVTVTQLRGKKTESSRSEKVSVQVLGTNHKITTPVYRFELRTGTFDKTMSYRLVLRDVDSDAEVQSLPVVIDRSFGDDF